MTQGVKFLNFYLNNFLMSLKPESPNQERFFAHIETIIPKNRSLVAEVSDVLDISMDSAYRRLRGETLLNYDEVNMLCKHFQISFDSINENTHEVVNFWYPRLRNTQEDFVSYFHGLKDDLAKSLSGNSDNKHVIYAAEDIPIFHYFRYPMLAAFKMHYWMRAILNVDDLQKKKFNPSDIDPGLAECGQIFYHAYQSISSTEIWTDTTIEGVLRQMQFYWDSGVFESADQAVEICDELIAMLSEIEKHVQHGCKFQNQPSNSSAKFDFYLSEIELGNNCIVLRSGESETVYLGHLSFQSIKTNHKAYVEDTIKWLENLKPKSHFISSAAETTRYQFFQSCRSRVNRLKDKVLGS